MHLFVLVSTGQKVANLPPVLELAQPGDAMIWIESEEARQRNWTERPREILEKSGLKTEAVVEINQLNDPFAVNSALKPFVNTVAHRFKSIYLVTNGGTKHTPIGLLRAFESLSPQLLYGEERPAVYSIHFSGFNSSPKVSPYTRHSLDLPTILYLNGYTLAKGSTHRRIWPDELGDEIASEMYGVDEAYTRRLHADPLNWGVFGPKRHPARFEQLPLRIPDEYECWRKKLEALLSGADDEKICDFYYATLRLGKSAENVGKRRKIRKVQQTIGMIFERAVARRVRAWQDLHRHPSIQSIWMSVQIARDETSERVEMEFDIILVLKNGILLHLECKAANFAGRQLEINAYRLKQAGSQQARLAVVMPLFIGSNGQLLVPRQHENRRLLDQQIGPKNVLTLTLPGQPEEYQVEIGGKRQSVRCPSFEQSLDELLRPYRL